MTQAQDVAGDYCQASVREGIKLILETRVAEMIGLREAALRWDDIEGVHDMRVASRRLRSALRDFRPYLRARVPQRKLKKLAASLGQVRDHDVALASLEKLGKNVPDNIRPGLEKLIGRRHPLREQARVELTMMLEPASLFAWKEKFLARIEQATRIAKQGIVQRSDGSQNNDAVQKFNEAGREIMLANFHALRQTSGSLYHPFEVEPLHRMRIAAKRFRYSMELFSPCRNRQFSFFTDEVAELQSSLGKLHDCDVWIAALGEHLAEGTDAKTKRRQSVDNNQPLDEDERRATFYLLGHFIEARARHYRKTLERWREWETTNFAARLDASLQ